MTHPSFLTELLKPAKRQSAYLLIVDPAPIAGANEGSCLASESIRKNPTRKALDSKGGNAHQPRSYLRGIFCTPYTSPFPQSSLTHAVRALFSNCGRLRKLSGGAN
jgi:hypothetical protein